MVKVVGRDESALKRVTCRSCASILEYKLSEIKTYQASDYSGDTWKESYIDCPDCGVKVIVKRY